RGCRAPAPCLRPAAGMRPRPRRCTGPASAAAGPRRPTGAASASFVEAQRVADRLPPRVAAVHVLRIESRLAQLHRGLAADVEAIRAVDDHRLGLRQLADPLLQLLRITPLDAIGRLLLARNVRPRAYVDDLDRLAGGHHLLHFLHADALDV